MLSRKNCNLIAAIGCFALVAYAYFYMEKTLYLIPCPLCYAQRLAFVVLGVLFVLAAFFPGAKKGKLIHTTLLLLAAIGGAALSIRHLYLQNLPKDQLASCGVDFYGMWDVMPFGQAVISMLSGASDCGSVQWQWLGLSIPGWTLLAFIGFALWALWHNAFRGA
ncbi:disulfide bond formation protein B [Ostreibacterium oceani]|uniref:Disulfide bond formation protein B n=1 Tax=Ostreibacterium oceani TaxID=2654998 RepID=A0A6N7EZ08_9GAMM|nr:disulfide bond formation protein B [Ostreibacterium oceani]MPV86397.1 disulfide bond formation protein B [Ostreibacterium oceani]